MIEFIPLDDFPNTYYSEEKLAHWLTNCARAIDHDIQRLTYQFCDETTMLDYNRQYLNHDYYTDILTFPANKAGHAIEGDILINVDRLKDNAKTFDTTVDQELLRLLAHGLLHLCGYDDVTPAAKSKMTAAEDQCIALMENS